MIKTEEQAKSCMIKAFDFLIEKHNLDGKILAKEISLCLLETINDYWIPEDRQVSKIYKDFLKFFATQ